MPSKVEGKLGTQLARLRVRIMIYCISGGLEWIVYMDSTAINELGFQRNKLDLCNLI